MDSDYIKRKGAEAALHGERLSANPYAPGTRAHRDWRDGYHGAYGYTLPARCSPLDAGPL
jgi:hypothetical protein